MPEVPPLPPIQRALTVNAAPTTVMLKLTLPPPASVIALPVGTTLSGNLVSRDNKGNFLFRTLKGDIHLKADSMFSLGMSMAVTIEQAGDNLQLRLNSVNGKPVEAGRSDAGRDSGSSKDAPKHSAQHGVDSEPDVIITTGKPQGNALGTYAPTSAALKAMANALSQQNLAAMSSNEQAINTTQTFTANKSDYGVQNNPARIMVTQFSPANIPTSEIPRITERLIKTLTDAVRQLEAKAGGGLLDQSPLAANKALAQTIENIANGKPVSLVFQAVNSGAGAGAATTGSAINTASTLLTKPDFPTQTVPSSTAPQAGEAILGDPSFPEDSTPSSLTLKGAASQPSNLQNNIPTTLRLESANVPSNNIADNVANNSGGDVEIINGIPVIKISAPSPNPATDETSAALNITPQSTQNTQKISLTTPFGVLNFSAESFANSGVKLGGDTTLKLLAAGELVLDDATVTQPLISGKALPEPSFKSLEAAVAALSKNDMQSSLNLAASFVSKPDGKLALNLLNLISALGSNQLSSGFRKLVKQGVVDAIDKLGDSNLLRGIMEEVMQMSQPATERGASSAGIASNWQAYMIPMLAGDEIHKIKLFINKDETGDEQSSTGRPGGGSRFVFELDLNNLGLMQLEGLFKATQSNRNFDLHITTQHNLPVDVKGDIERIFYESLPALGLIGQISIMQSAVMARQFEAVDSQDTKKSEEYY
jgi:hypothetical protein